MIDYATLHAVAILHAVAEKYGSTIHYDTSTRYHVHAHRWICQFEGQTDGEMVEREWKVGRPAADVKSIRRNTLMDLDAPLLVSDNSINLLC
jgi:hypothetical protein